MEDIRKPIGVTSCRFPVVAPFQGDFWYYKMDGGGGEWVEPNH